MLLKCVVLGLSWKRKRGEKDSIRRIIILYGIGKRGIGTPWLGRNPILDLISEILNARDASSFDRSARTNTSQMERTVEKYRKGRSRSDSVRRTAPDCRGQKIFLLDFESTSIDRSLATLTIKHLALPT